MNLLTTITKSKLSLGLAIALGSTVLSACTPNKSPEQATLQLVENTQASTPLAHYKNRSIQDEVFYFVMPDRFYNGNSDNDNGSKTKAISAGGFDKTNKGTYHGGDIAGLTEKLDYIQGMGVTAIWLTPILRNQAVQGDDAGYHGYWVLDFTEIDPHLGSNEDLKTFIDAAHKKNIKVFFDIITNHTADVIKYEECHGKDGLQWLVENDDKGCPYKSLSQVASGDGYKTVIPKGQEQLKVPSWLNDPAYYHNQGDSTFSGENSLYGDFSGLDDIDTNNPEVAEKMIGVFSDLISEFKPDGFRIDTVKHVNMEFWSAFAPALVKHAKSEGIDEFFMFGEVYSFDSKELASFTTQGKMQSVLDFAFQSAVTQAVVEQKGTDVLANWLANDHYYSDQDSDANQLLNFTGNHDMGRFANFVAKSEFNYDEEEQIQRNLLASSMMYFMRGVPIVYYGDEQGFIGDGHDKDSRQDMMPSKVASYNDDNLLATDATTADDNFDNSHLFYQTFKQFSQVYQANPSLRYGQQATLKSSDMPGIYAFTRDYTPADPLSAQKSIVVYNTSNAPKQFVLENQPHAKLIYQGLSDKSTLSKQDNAITISLPPLSFVILASTNEQ